MSRNYVLLFGLTSLICMLSRSVTAGIDCQKQLRLDENRQVCERYVRMMPELQHVQRVSPYSSTLAKLDRKNTLYIFDAAIFNGEQAVYNFPGKITLPENSVLAGNQLNNKKARLVFENVSGGKSGLVIGPGARYALSDVELVTYAKNVSLSRTLEIHNARQVSLDRVSISGYFEPLPNTSISQELLMVSCWGNCPSTISISDSRIHLPYMESNNLSRTALAAKTPMDTEGTGIKLFLNRTEIVLDNYSPEKIAILITGKVQLEPGSVCNSVIDEENGGIDLLPGAHKSLFVAVPSSGREQAIGFTNGYGFGWYTLSNGSPHTAYNIQDFWHQKGLNLQCPGSNPAGYTPTCTDKVTLATLTGIAILVVGCLAIDRFINQGRWQESKDKQAP